MYDVCPMACTRHNVGARATGTHASAPLQTTAHYMAQNDDGVRRAQRTAGRSSKIARSETRSGRARERSHTDHCTEQRTANERSLHHKHTHTKFDEVFASRSTFYYINIESMCKTPPTAHGAKTRVGAQATCGVRCRGCWGHSTHSRTRARTRFDIYSAIT